MSSLHIYFICSGNICRSPYAEVRMRQLLRQFGLADEVTVSSAGTLGITGEPAHPTSVAIAERHGATLRGFASRGVNAETIEASDLIVCMEACHLEKLSRSYPQAVDRMRLLCGSRQGNRNRDVPDPIGTRRDDYEASLSMIDVALEQLVIEVQALFVSHAAND